MRGLSLTLAMLLATAIVEAQRHPSPPPRPPQAPSSPMPTRPTTVAPPTVLPFPPLPPQPTGGFTSGVVFPPRVNPAYRPGRGGRGGGYGGYGGAYGGGYFYSPDVAPAPAAAPVAPVPTGELRLSGTPSEAQVFVDGYYVATLGDVESRRALTLPEGPHRIELKATSYTPTAFDVQIDPNAAISYRASLDYVRAPAPPPRTVAPAAGPTKMYLIPNCYLGNVPPRSDRLPPGCDVKHVRVIS